MRGGAFARYLAVIVAAVLFLIPFYLIIRNGLSTDADITAPNWEFFPTSLHWSNITELFDDQSVPMAPQANGDLNGYTWADKGLGYSLVGPTPSERLHPLANEARKQLASAI